MSRTGNMPIPFPDESCYSLLCRYAVRRGLMTTAQISEELFGYTEPLSGYLFKPFRKRNIQDWFIDGKIPWKYGEAHSCYPYFSVFVRSEYAESLRSCSYGTSMRAGMMKRINRECGFTRNHKRNLWYCPECVKEDLSQHGETCWRRLPQLPGANYCPLHNSKFKESGVQYRDIQYQILPATYALINIPDSESEDDNVYIDRYIRLAKDMAWLLNNGFLLHGFSQIKSSYYNATGKPLQETLFYKYHECDGRKSSFEDCLIKTIMRDTAMEYVNPFSDMQIGTIVAIEDEFSTVENFFTSIK